MNGGASTNVERKAGKANKTMPPGLVKVKPMNDVMPRRRDIPGNGTSLSWCATLATARPPHRAEPHDQVMASESDACS
jgi:hypothetical protein